MIRWIIWIKTPTLALPKGGKGDYLYVIYKVERVTIKIIKSPQHVELLWGLLVLWGEPYNG